MENATSPTKKKKHLEGQNSEDCTKPQKKPLIANDSKQEDAEMDLEKDTDVFETLDVEDIELYSKNVIMPVFEIKLEKEKFQDLMETFQNYGWIDRTQCTHREDIGTVYFLSEETSKEAMNLLKTDSNPPTFIPLHAPVSRGVAMDFEISELWWNSCFTSIVNDHIIDQLEALREEIKAKAIRKMKTKNVLQIFWTYKIDMIQYLKNRIVHFQGYIIQLSHPPPIPDPKYTYTIIKPIPKTININGFAAHMFEQKPKTCVAYIQRIFRTTSVLITYYSKAPTPIKRATEENIIKTMAVQFKTPKLAPHLFDHILYHSRIEKRKQNKQPTNTVTSTNDK
jgi:hypothetical protein